MIPQVRAWRATCSDGARWIVWAPTKTLARLNLRGAGVYETVNVWSRYAHADGAPIPTNMVQAFDDWKRWETERAERGAERFLGS